ncbi:hypothetical protein CBL_00132 [Carabus blaptoides fortunei]
MKTTLVICVVVLIAGISALPDRPDCNVDPVKNNPLCDLLPPGCRIPKCGRDYNYKKAMWFGNECYMNQYNKLCRTNFRKTADSSCNRNERPPPVFEPCPFPLKHF